MHRDNFSRRSFLEKQTALSLVQFSTQQSDLELGSGRVENLLGTLIVSPSCNMTVQSRAEALIRTSQAEAPADVVEKMMDAEAARDDNSHPLASVPVQLSASQRSELLLLQELIRRRLDG